MYGYLIGDLIFLAIWLVLFIMRKDLRHEMLVMSVLIGVISVVTEYCWYTKDWWRPEAIPGIWIGFEHFLMGFGSGGIIASIYEEVFKKRLYKRTSKKYSPRGSLVLLMLAWFTSVLFWTFHITSFWSSTVAMIVIALLMFYYRRDLLAAGFLTGLCMVIVSLPMYWGILLIYPHWVQETYLFNYLSGILVFGIPIEELVFWFLAGFLWGPFYEYWKGEKFRKEVLQ